MKDTTIVTYTFTFNMIMIIMFSIIYSYIGPTNFKKLNPLDKLTYLDYLFYAVTIQSGVGLPDINAVSTLAKTLALIQQLILMASAYILIRLFFADK